MPGEKNMLENVQKGEKKSMIALKQPQISSHLICVALNYHGVVFSISIILMDLQMHAQKLSVSINSD